MLILCVKSWLGEIELVVWWSDAAIWYRTEWELLKCPRISIWSIVKKCSSASWRSCWWISCFQARMLLDWVGCKDVTQILPIWSGTNFCPSAFNLISGFFEIRFSYTWLITTSCEKPTVKLWVLKFSYKMKSAILRARMISFDRQIKRLRSPRKCPTPSIEPIHFHTT